MPDRLEGIAGTGLSEALLGIIIEEHQRRRVPRFELLWSYYRNPLEPTGASDDRDNVAHASSLARPRPRLIPAQARGLPDRLIGHRDLSEDDRLRTQRELVIENDIAWRIQTMVDFMFGAPVRIISAAPDEARRAEIERVIDAIWEASGGVALLQDMALLGHVFGTVDLVLRLNEHTLLTGGPRAFTEALASGSPDALAELLRIETIDPRRGAPVVSADDYRRLDGYVISFTRDLNDVDEKQPTPLQRRSRLAGLFGRPRRERPRRRASEVTEVMAPGVRQVYEGERLVRDDRSVLLPGILPIAHVQNQSQPLAYDGLGEVEPLMPLQDELNTRLSDRANRVTMQSFKMYLAKRLEGFDRAPVGPGVVWSTDDPEASIESFGGDAASPSETTHIEQIREAMDKVSGVPPLAGGVVRARIGNLSSATALRITLMSLLAKTARKRVAYGAAIERMTRLALTALDASGAFRTTPDERALRLVWPDPTPVESRDATQAARAKVELGVDRGLVLDELGYAPTDAGVA